MWIFVIKLYRRFSAEPLISLIFLIKPHDVAPKWAGFFLAVLKSESTLKDFLVNIAIKTIKCLNFLNFLLKHKHLHKTVLKLSCGDHSVSHHSKQFPSTLKMSRLFCYTGFFVALFICMMIHQRCLLCACEPVCVAGANRG